jgi:GT2 family glycosyltransferase
MNESRESTSSSRGLVSVIIVNYNGANVIGECLQSVFTQLYRPIEVIVLDNASTDESRRVINDRFPEVRLIVNDENLGFAAGNNRGVAEAKGEYVVLLNNDTIVEAGWLPALIQMFRLPNVSAVTSRVITDGVPSAFYEMNGTINYLGYNIMREFTDLSRVFFAGGASLMFRRKEIGQPFLDEYFLYHEDVFLSWKLRLLGGSVAMAQQSVVRHKGSVTVRQQTSGFVTFYQERNRLLNALLFYEARTLLLLTPYFIADGVAKLILSVISQRKSFVGIVRAYSWILAHTAWIKRERVQLQCQRAASDREIMNAMSCKVIEGESSLAKFMNGVSRLYARIVGLAFHE